MRRSIHINSWYILRGSCFASQRDVFVKVRELAGADNCQNEPLNSACNIPEKMPAHMLAIIDGC